MAKIILLAAGLGAFLVALLLFSKSDPIGAAKVLAQGSFGSESAINGTLRQTMPLLLAGLAVFLSLRAGLFNIGVEGQLVVGALAAAVIALKFPGPVGIVLAVVGSCAAGALWAVPAGIIRAYRNGHEVITTIMLNSVATFLTSYLVESPFKAPGQQEPTTTSLPASSQLPPLLTLGSLTVSTGLVLGIVMTVALFFWLRRSVSGFELQAAGANPRAALFAGVQPKRVIVRAMAASGAIAGFAGCMQVLCTEGRFYSGFSPGYGFDALGVALLAGGNALGVLPASLLFGALAKGGTALQIEGVPKGITTVILGLLIVVAAAFRYRTVKTVA